MGRPLRAVSLFAGAGGLDLGLEAAGFEVSLCLDFDHWCKQTLQANRPWKVICADIAQVASAQILADAGLTKGEVDLLVGGPPCQPFSKSGYWARTEERPGGLEDHRADPLRHFLRVLEDTLPRAYLIENVYGFMYRPKASWAPKELPLDYMHRYLQAIEERTGVRYSLSARLINAADYGVPQIRERVFVVGFRDGAVFRWPSPTHFNPDGWRKVTLEERLIELLTDALKGPLPEDLRSEYQRRLARLHTARSRGSASSMSLLFDEADLWSGKIDGLTTTEEAFRSGGMQPWRTAWDAIGDLDEDRPVEPDEVVAGKWGHLLPHIPEGFNYLYFTEKLGASPALFKWRSRYWTFLLKLARNRPSWTIQAQPGPYVGPFHWRNRRLSVLEMKRLMTFPDDYQVIGPRREVQRQLGNAVPPLLARILAEAIREQLLARTHAGSDSASNGMLSGEVLQPLNQLRL